MTILLVIHEQEEGLVSHATMGWARSSMQQSSVCWSPTGTNAHDCHRGQEVSVSSEMQQLGQLLKMLAAKPDHIFEPSVSFTFF